MSGAPRSWTPPPQRRARHQASYIRYVREHLQIGATVTVTAGELEGDTGTLIEDDASDTPKFKWNRYKAEDGCAERRVHLSRVQLVRTHALPASLCTSGCGLPAEPGKPYCCKGCAFSSGSHDEDCQRRAQELPTGVAQEAQRNFSVEVSRVEFARHDETLQKLVSAALAAGWNSPLDLISRGNLVMIDNTGRIWKGLGDRPNDLKDSMFPLVLLYRISEAPGGSSATGDPPASSRPGYTKLVARQAPRPEAMAGACGGRGGH